MKQIEIFSRTDVSKLQTQINEFLQGISQDDKKEFVNIKFSTTETDEHEPLYAALVIYDFIEQ